MSAYDTVDRIDAAHVEVKVYCEVPMVPTLSVLLGLYDDCVYLDPDQAIRIATALLNAAQRVRHACEVDSVVAGRRR